VLKKLDARFEELHRDAIRSDPNLTARHAALSIHTEAFCE
jgi:hypothetical protein